MTERPPYLRRAGDTYTPTSTAVGPWGPETVSGMVIAGLVAHVAEQAGGSTEFLGTRLTVDMIRMAATGDLVASSRILREGRRLRLVDVAIEQDGKSVAHGRAVFARRSQAPTGTVWSAASAMPDPPPDDGWPPGGGLAYLGAGGTPNPNFHIWRDSTQQKLVWFRLPLDLVEDEPTSQFARAACIADVVNPLTNWGSEGLRYINSDLTLQLARLPDGLAIGMIANDRQEADGVSVGTATMHDHSGPIGVCSVTALASETPIVLGR